MKRIALALSLLATSISATASQQEGKISQLSIKANGFTYFYMTGGTRTEKPACATMPYFVIKDENSVAGQAQYSALLGAYTAKKQLEL